MGLHDGPVLAVHTAVGAGAARLQRARVGGRLVFGLAAGDFAGGAGFDGGCHGVFFGCASLVA